jgi:hypothetical protein
VPLPDVQSKDKVPHLSHLVRKHAVQYLLLVRNVYVHVIEIDRATKVLDASVRLTKARQRRPTIVNLRVTCHLPVFG